MRKLATLKLYGNTEGFQTILEIGNDQARPHTIISGQLPLLQDVLRYYQQWQVAYYHLGQPIGQANRTLRPVSIKLEGTLTTRRKRCLDLAETLKSSFNEWLQSASFYATWEVLLRELQRLDPIQVIIQSDEIALFKLPWHQWTLFQTYDAVEIGFSAVNYEYLPPSQLPSQTSSLRILAILGHAEGIDVEHDRAILEQLPGAEVKFLAEKTRQELSEALWDQPWDMLFFAGHSETETDQGHIYLNPTDRLTLSELKATLGQAVKRGLQLAIFNSCDGLVDLGGNTPIPSRPPMLFLCKSI
jgi:hypothetical protein